MNLLTDFSKRVKTSSLLAGLAVSLNLFGYAAQADVKSALDQLPTDAHMAVVIPSLSAFNDQSMQFIADSEIPVPLFMGPVDMLLGQAGLMGVDRDGAMIVSVPNVLSLAGEVPDLVVAIPVTNYSDFVQGLGGNPEGVAEIFTPDGGLAYVKKSGQYAIAGMFEDTVKNYEPGQQSADWLASLGKQGAAHAESGHFSVMLDIEAMAPVVMPLVQVGYMQAMEEMRRTVQGGGLSQAEADTQKAIAQAGLNALDGFLKSANAVIASVDFTDNGLGQTIAFSYKPESPLTQFLKPVDGNAEGVSMLNDLPDRPYIFAASANFDAIDIAAVNELIVEMFPDDSPFGAIIEQSMGGMAMLEDIKSVASAYYVADMDQMMGGNPIQQVKVYETKDGAAFKNTFQEELLKMNGLMDRLLKQIGEAAGDEDAEAMAMQMGIVDYKTTYESNVTRLAGMDVDRYTMVVDMPMEALQMMGPLGGFVQAMSSSDGLVASKGNKVVLTSVPDEDLFIDVVDQFNAADGVGVSDAIEMLRDEESTSQAIAEAYFSIDGVMTMVQPMMMMFGMEMEQPMNGVAPIAMSLGMEDNSVAARYFLPSETVSYIVEMAMPMVEMFGGMGMGPGGDPFADDMGGGHGDPNQDPNHNDGPPPAPF